MYERSSRRARMLKKTYVLMLQTILFLARRAVILKNLMF